MKSHKNLFFNLLIFLIFFTFNLCITFHNSDIQVDFENGTVDYSSYSFSDDRVYSINELFYPDLSSNIVGYSCYRLKLILPEEMDCYAIRIPAIMSKFMLYSDNKLIYSQTNSSNLTLPYPRTFIINRTDSVISLKIYVEEKDSFNNLSFSNLIYNRDLIIGKPNAIFYAQKCNDLWNSFIILAFLICALYHFIFFCYLPKLKQNLFIFIYCIAAGTCVLFSKQAIIHYVFSSISLISSVKIYFGASIIKNLSLFLYIRKLSSKNKLNYSSIIICSISFLLLITSFFSNIKILHFLYISLLIIMFANLLFNLVYINKLQKNENQNLYVYVSLGLISIITGVYSEFLFFMAYQPAFSLLAVCELAFIFLQTYSSTKYYNLSLLRIKQMSPLLQDSLYELQSNPSTFICKHIKPDFLYETLNSINKYIDVNNEKVDILIQSLAKYLRQTLNFTNDSKAHTLKKELSLCNAYINLVKEQHPEIKFNLNINTDLPDTLIPQRAILALVENSVTTAFKETLQPVVNIIVDQIIENMIYIEVSTNGIGISEKEINQIISFPNPHLNTNIYYINKQLLNDFNSALKFKSSPKKGTKFFFTLEIREVAENEF